MWNKYLWIIIVLAIIVLLIIFRKYIFTSAKWGGIFYKKSIDGRRGGILEGASHKNGGIKGRLRSTGETIEMEGTEAILNGVSMRMKERLVCEGTPAGVASEINEIGGGLEFDRNGRCVIKN